MLVNFLRRLQLLTAGIPVGRKDESEIPDNLIQYFASSWQPKASDGTVKCDKKISDVHKQVSHSRSLFPNPSWSVQLDSLGYHHRRTSQKTGAEAPLPRNLGPKLFSAEAKICAEAYLKEKIEYFENRKIWSETFEI